MKRSSLFSGFCLLLLFLSACGERELPMAVPVSPPPQTSGTSTIGLLAVSALLGKNEDPKSVDGVYGLLLLPRTQQHNQASLENICRAFFDSFRPTINSSQPSRYTVRPTFWPDTRPSTTLPRSTTCANLIKNYNYDYAEIKLKALSLEGVRGPVLAAYNQRKNQSVQLDLSGVIDKKDIDFAMQKWRSIITQDVEDWSSQWANRMAAETRILLTNFAPVLMKVLSTTPSEAASKPVAPNQIYRGTISDTRSNEIHFTPL